MLLFVDMMGNLGFVWTFQLCHVDSGSYLNLLF